MAGLITQTTRRRYLEFGDDSLAVYLNKNVFCVEIHLDGHYSVGGSTPTTGRASVRLPQRKVQRLGQPSERFPDRRWSPRVHFPRGRHHDTLRLSQMEG